MQFARAWAAALVLSTVASAPAFADDLIGADRPGLANSSSTVGRFRFQVEAGVYQDHNGGTDESLFATPLLLRFGLSESFELRLEGDSYQRQRLASQSSNGWAPMSLGLKWRFVQEGGGHPAVGVIARVFPPSGSGQFHDPHATGDLTLTADKGFGDHWAVNPNLGIVWSDDGERFTAGVGALTVQYSFNPAVGVFVDGSWQSPEGHDGSSAGVVDVGGAWIIRRENQLDLSFGWGVHGETVPDWFWSAGVSRRF